MRRISWELEEKDGHTTYILVIPLDPDMELRWESYADQAQLYLFVSGEQNYIQSFYIDDDYRKDDDSWDVPAVLNNLGNQLKDYFLEYVGAIDMRRKYKE